MIGERYERLFSYFPNHDIKLIKLLKIRAMRSFKNSCSLECGWNGWLLLKLSCILNVFVSTRRTVTEWKFTTVLLQKPWLASGPTRGIASHGFCDQNLDISSWRHSKSISYIIVWFARMRIAMHIKMYTGALIVLLLDGWYTPCVRSLL